MPTIVLSEFYAQAAKRVGGQEARLRFQEIIDSDLDVIDLNIGVSEVAGALRHQYKEKVPWGDCIIAATALAERVNLVLSEDSHFEIIREVKAKRLEELSL